MGTNYKEWNYDEFIAFVMLYAANADYEIVEDEKELIIGKVGEQEYKQLLKFASGNHDTENINIILELKKKYITTKEDLADLFDQINEVINADGVVNLYEKNMNNALHFLFDHDV